MARPAADIDPEGNLIDPVRVDWVAGGVFTTPPGWWHSHHNESESDAWVLPIQVRLHIRYRSAGMSYSARGLY
jgi:hypothetical protein